MCFHQHIFGMESRIRRGSVEYVPFSREGLVSFIWGTALQYMIVYRQFGNTLV